ncbi:4-nitrophenol 2-monooxygenase, oxygenase component [Nostoc sp. NIES-4103]|nr:4-nitrophenol 2-monooxygenase, oxygenase component [Nostoc sp. NIES-4103]
MFIQDKSATVASTSNIKLIAGSPGPLTGSEYLESLRDGREVYVYGEKVSDVTTHPAFRNAARTIARLYDALYDPKYQEVLTRQTDTNSHTRTHKFFVASRTAQELLEARDAIATWSRFGYGFVSRSPDYKASFIATLGTQPEYYAPYHQNAWRWYKEIQERMWFVNHAFVNPNVDRDKPPHEVADVFLHVHKETDAGLVVSGAKMVATGAALTNFNLIAPYASVPIEKEEFILAFIAPVQAPGLKLICRPSYEMRAAIAGSPFDYPLSSRMDENDAVLIFDNVLIPWENVLLYRDKEKAKRFFPDSGFMHRFIFHGCTRFAVKLDFVAGLVLKAIESTGVNKFRGVQTQIGEILAWRNLFWGLSTAQALNPVSGPGDTVLPNMVYGSAYRTFAPTAWTKVKAIIEDVVAGALIVTPSSAEDFKNPVLRPYLDRFYRGSNGYDALSKVKLMKLLWEVIGTEFGGRQELYERNYTGNHEQIRLDVLHMAQEMGAVEEYKKFVDQCMSEYDLDGWATDDYINSHDVNAISREN